MSGGEGRGRDLCIIFASMDELMMRPKGWVALLVVIPSWCIGVAEIYERIESRSAMCKLTTVDSFYYV